MSTRRFNGTLAGLTSHIVRFDGNDVPQQPDRTATLSSGCRGRINDVWRWMLRGEVACTGRMRDSEANISQADANTRDIARLGFEKHNLDIEVNGRSIFGDDCWSHIRHGTSVSEPGALLLVPYPTPTSPPIAVQGLMLPPPDSREVGIGVHHRFQASGSTLGGPASSIARCIDCYIVFCGTRAHVAPLCMRGIGQCGATHWSRSDPCG